MDAAHAQHSTLAEQTVGSVLVSKLAGKITAIDEDLAEIDAQVTEHFACHENAAILLSLPGFGPVLAATFLALTGAIVGWATITVSALPASGADAPTGIVGAGATLLAFGMVMVLTTRRRQAGTR